MLIISPFWPGNLRSDNTDTQNFIIGSTSVLTVCFLPLYYYECIYELLASGILNTGLAVQSSTGTDWSGMTGTVDCLLMKFKISGILFPRQVLFRISSGNQMSNVLLFLTVSFWHTGLICLNNLVISFLVRRQVFLFHLPWSQMAS